MEILQTAVRNYSEVIVLFVIIALFWRASKWLTFRQTVKETEQKRMIIESVVRAVEQLHDGKIGLEKLAHAKDLSISVLASYHLGISVEELTIYIESAVQKIRLEEYEKQEQKNRTKILKNLTK